MESKVLCAVPSTCLVSLDLHQTFLTFLYCSNTPSVDLTFFLTCSCFSIRASLAHSNLSFLQYLFMLQKSIWLSFPLGRLPPPLPPPSQHPRVCASSALPFAGWRGPCKQGLGFSNGFSPVSSLLTVSSEWPTQYVPSSSAPGPTPTHTSHVQECSQQH